MTYNDSFLSDITATLPESLLTTENDDFALSSINDVLSSSLNSNNGHIKTEKYIDIIQESPVNSINGNELEQSAHVDISSFLSQKNTSLKKANSTKKSISDVSTLEYDKNFIAITDIAKKCGTDKKKIVKKTNTLFNLKHGFKTSPFRLKNKCKALIICEDECSDDRIMKKVQIYYDDKTRFYETDDQLHKSLSSGNYTFKLIQLKNLINEIVQTEIQYLINLKILTKSFLPFIANNNATLNMLTYYTNILLKKHKMFIEEVLGFFAEIEIMSFLQVDFNNFKTLNLKIVEQENWNSIEKQYYKVLKHLDFNNIPETIDNDNNHRNVNDGSILFFAYFVILDYVSLKIADVVSTYLYENFIKVYYILLRILKNKEKSKFNTKLCESITGLNSLLSIKKKTFKLNKINNIDLDFILNNSPRDVFNNITFESLLQVPINRIMKYKIFMSKILTDYNVENRCRINIAVNFNDLLKKLEKIDNFQLDYVYTIKQRRYNIKDDRNKQKSVNGEKEAELYDPNEFYNNIVDKIKFNYKDTVISNKPSNGENPLNLESFGSIILLQPCIIRYISNFYQSFFGFKESENSHKYKKQFCNNNMGICQESKMVLLLFKSHLLIMKPCKLQKSYVLNVVFSIPLTVCEIIENQEQTLIENSNTSINIKIECNFLKYEIMITSWNDIEHKNFTAKLQNLMAYYYKPVINSKGEEALESEQHLVYQDENDYSLSKESLVNDRFLKFNDINDIFKQFIYPKNIVICDYKSEHFDNPKVCYNSKIYFIKNNFVINKHRYTDMDKNWINVNSNVDYIFDSDDNWSLDINFDDRAFIEECLDTNKLWYNEIDILRLKDFEVLDFDLQESTKRRKFMIKPKGDKRSFFKTKLKKTASVFNKCTTQSIKSKKFIIETGSHITTSDNSVLYLASANILDSAKKLGSSILRHKYKSSHYDIKKVASREILATDNAEIKKEAVVNTFSSKKNYYWSDETISNEQPVERKLLIIIKNCFVIDQNLKTPLDTFVDSSKRFTKEDKKFYNGDNDNSNKSGYFVDNILKQSTRLLYKMFL